MLGQVSAATTLDIYTHATSDMQYATARKIDCGIGKAVPQKNIPQLGQENAPVTVKKPSMTNFKPCVGHKRESGTDFVIEINYREIMLFYIINICFQRKNISQDNIRMNNTSHSLISCYLMMYACALCIIYLFHPIDHNNIKNILIKAFIVYFRPASRPKFLLLVISSNLSHSPRYIIQQLTTISYNSSKRVVRLSASVSKYLIIK